MKVYIILSVEYKIKDFIDKRPIKEEDTQSNPKKYN